MSRDNSCQVCYVIWADIGFRNAHVSVFPALAGSPPSRIYAEALIRGVCKDSYDVRAAPCESFIVRRKGADTMPQYRAERNYENLNKGIFQGTTDLGIPYIAPEDCDVENWISFNYAKTAKEEQSRHGVHFFIDDYQFARLWTQPDTYLPLLQRFPAVMTPDFSTYTDFPVAIQLYNHYRKHWLGAYWQYEGMLVIPTISWSDHRSYDWCFDGEPVGGCVAVSAVGTQMAAAQKQLFIDGYREMMGRLKPSKIIFYGDVPDECYGNIVQIQAFQDAIKKRRKEAQK